MINPTLGSVGSVIHAHVRKAYSKAGVLQTAGIGKHA